MKHVVEDCATFGRRLVLKGYCPLQKKIRFQRLVRCFEAIIRRKTEQVFQMLGLNA